MFSSKIFKKENSDRYEIRVRLSTDSSSNRFYWDIDVSYCPAGKRKFINLDCQCDWEYRKLDESDARKKYYQDFLLTHIPAGWIIEVQQDILNELSKPII